MEKADLRARWVYAIEAEDENGVPPESLERAAALLSVGDQKGAAGAVSGCAAWCETSFYVSPRKGTISPWSTKATDIFKNCGVKGVKRVERAIRFTVCSSGASAFPASFDEVKPALPALFDRMTEGVYLSLDDLFDVLPPQPGREFDVLGRGIEAIREANVELGLALFLRNQQIISCHRKFDIPYC